MSGGCKMLSLGDKCDCPLCLADKLKYANSRIVELEIIENKYEKLCILFEKALGKLKEYENLYHDYILGASREEIEAERKRIKDLTTLEVEKGQPGSSGGLVVQWPIAYSKNLVLKDGQLSISDKPKEDEIPEVHSSRPDLIYGDGEDGKVLEGASFTRDEQFNTVIGDIFKELTIKKEVIIDFDDETGTLYVRLSGKTPRYSVESKEDSNVVLSFDFMSLNVGAIILNAFETSEEDWLKNPVRNRLHPHLCLAIDGWFKTRS